MTDNASAALRRLVKRALSGEVSMPCMFWACDGPDAPREDMKTCRNCAWIQDARAVLKDSGNGP